MVPLFILFGTFGILFLLNKYFIKRLSISFIGRVAMALMMILAGIAHFVYDEPMVAMMPDIIPWKLEIVYLTGILEFVAAIGLLWEGTARVTSIMLMIFFLAILPANILGSIRGVNIPGAEYGVWYLLFRIPLQMFFLWWVWYFGVRSQKLAEKTKS